MSKKLLRCALLLLALAFPAIAADTVNGETGNTVNNTALSLTATGASGVTAGSSGVAGSLFLYDGDSGGSANTLKFIAQPMAGNVVLTWPAANASGVLTNNGSGTLTWAAGGGGSVSALDASDGSPTNAIKVDAAGLIRAGFFDTASPDSGVFQIGTASGTGLIDTLTLSAGAAAVGSGPMLVFNDRYGGSQPTWRVAEIAAVYNNGASFGGDLIFRVNTGANGTSTAEKMRLKFNGNLGIADTNPDSPLTVAGTTHITGAGNLKMETGYFYENAENDGHYRVAIGAGTNDGLMVCTASGNTNTASNRLALLSGGSVGGLSLYDGSGNITLSMLGGTNGSYVSYRLTVGSTSTPIAALQVEAASNADALRIVNTSVSKYWEFYNLTNSGESDLYMYYNGANRTIFRSGGQVDFAGKVTATGGLDAPLYPVGSITASVTQSQGQGALTGVVNVITICANANDTVTLPVAAAGKICVVANQGANTLQVFPASGDDLGAGVNTATTIVTGAHVMYIAADATTWMPI